MDGSLSNKAGNQEASQPGGLLNKVALHWTAYPNKLSQNDYASELNSQKIFFARIDPAGKRSPPLKGGLLMRSYHNSFGEGGLLKRSPPGYLVLVNRVSKGTNIA